jgi:predicted nucleic acid-binding protein
MSLIVISNATPIISLSSVGCEFILKELFGHIIIAQAVNRELKALDKPGSNFCDYEWVETVSIQNKEISDFLIKDLDKGEAETIALAKEMEADVVIIDENAGYQIARLKKYPPRNSGFQYNINHAQFFILWIWIKSPFFLPISQEYTAHHV